MDYKTIDGRLIFTNLKIDISLKLNLHKEYYFVILNYYVQIFIVEFYIYNYLLIIFFIEIVIDMKFISDIIL